MQACGPPVVRDGDPPPPFRWFSPQQQDARKRGGCPRCLPANARIATPKGEIPVAELAVGDVVWTLDENGRRVARALIDTSRVVVGPKHELTRITLADGRRVIASARHPTASGDAIASLVAGASLNGSVIERVETIPYAGTHTHDILPGGATGSYWSDGVLLDSTLR